MNDGGPAFPQHGWSSDPSVVERMKSQAGMTLWDFYAAEALNGLLVNSPWPLAHCDAATEAAADVADAMIAEREKRRASHPST